jgi:hypothetical protein
MIFWMLQVSASMKMIQNFINCHYIEGACTESLYPTHSFNTPITNECFTAKHPWLRSTLW